MIKTVATVFTALCTPALMQSTYPLTFRIFVELFLRSIRVFQVFDWYCGVEVPEITKYNDFSVSDCDDVSRHLVSVINIAPT